jgi:hyaluronoglucosaminidase
MKTGVIEGFFGMPWGHEARLGFVDFLGQHGDDFYIYAPKGDPFLRRRWREPMPGDTLRELAALNHRCVERGVSMGVGLTPFEIYLNYDASARGALRSKVEQLNAIGMDLLCVLFDDMRGDVERLPELQADVIADVCAWSNARNFAVCPTYYSYDARLVSQFGPPPKTYLRDFGRLVDPSIDIFWTGEKVISSGYPASHLGEVAEDLGRKPFIWDNHSSNDARNRTGRLYLDPSVGGWSLPAGLAAGLAVNPMNESYLSRIALSGYRRLLAHPGQPLDFEEVCRELCPPATAQRLTADADSFQSGGLDTLDAGVRANCLEWYGAQHADPFAQDVAAWLRGDYVFDPACLTT